MSNLAFHNDPSLAAMVRSQVEAHTAADEIIQGRYWENGKGCFIGCIAHGNSPSKVESMTGFPIMLTRIAESIFEGLPNDKAKDFPQTVISAPRVGADLSLVAWKFLYWLIDDVLKEYGDDTVRAACAPALQIVSDKSQGINPTAGAARAAADAAYAAADAAADAARAAAYAAAYAARAAAYAAYAARAAAYAARVAADAAAYAARAARVRQAEKLVELLSQA